MDREVRCAGCGRLLAVELENGLIEVKTNRQVLWAERVLLSCAKCGRQTQAEGGKKGLDKGAGGG